MKNRRRENVNYGRRELMSLMTSTAAISFANPLRVLIAGLSQGIISRARAQALAPGILPRNYIYIALNGGPPRWVFDLPLVPYKLESIIPNPHLITKFQSPTSGAYVTAPISRGGVTLNMPYLWTQNIPTVGGGTAPMANLLQNMLMIRGVSMGSDGHSNNQLKQTRPVPDSPSLDGAVADISNKQIPAVGLSGGTIGAYLSAKGIGIASSGGLSATQLNRILSPFDQSADGISQGFLNNETTLQATVNAALDKIALYAKSSAPGAENLFAVRSKSEELLKKGVSNLGTSYQSLVDKYTTLLNAVIASPVSGVHDVRLDIDSLSRKTNGTVAYTSITANSSLGPGADSRKIINSSTTLIGIAQNFAVTEYLITNGYSSSVNFGFTSPQNLNFDNVLGLNNQISATTNGIFGFDEHFGGAFTSLIINSFTYRALAACLNELVNQLKSKGLFDETVIQLGSEFSRCPGKDGSGSEHGWVAGCTSLYSGAIKAPMVLGNVLLDGGSSAVGTQFPGTWGAGANINVDGANQYLSIGHMTSTVAELLRVSPPMKNSGSLIKEVGSSIVPLVEYARNS